MSKETRTFHIDGNDYSFNFSVFKRFFNTYKTHNNITYSLAEKQIAEKLNVSSETIHSWRFEKNAPADIETIKNIADSLGIHDYLVLLIKKIGEQNMGANDRILDSLKRIYDAVILYLDDYDTSYAYLTDFYALKDKKYSDEEARNEIYDLASQKLHQVEIVLLQEYIILHKLEIYSKLENYIYSDLCNLWDGKLEYVTPEIQIVETNQGANSHEYYEVAFNQLNELMAEYF